MSNKLVKGFNGSRKDFLKIIPLSILIIGAFIGFAALSDSDNTTPQSVSNFPATVDVAKGYVLVELTSTNQVPKILHDYRRVIHGNFADHDYPKGTLPFYTSDGFWDSETRSLTVSTPKKFILPLYLAMEPK